MEDNQLTVTPAAIVYVLGAVAALLVLANIGAHLTAALNGYDIFPADDPGSRVDDLVRYFSLDRERNLPTFFSASLLAFAALLLSVITVFERKRNNSHRFYWAILSCGFLVMAVDEQFLLHEQLVAPGRELLGDDYLAIFHFAWVIPGIALVVILALFFWRFLFRLARPTRHAFMTASILYIGGAIGFELAGSYVTRSQGREDSVLYFALATLEESLEMAGAIVFIWALLVYIAQLQGASRGT